MGEKNGPSSESHDNGRKPLLDKDGEQLRDVETGELLFAPTTAEEVMEGIISDLAKKGLTLDE